MTEAEIQRAVFEHLATRGVPNTVYWHTPNDPRSRRKSGYRAGVADVSVVHGGRYFGLELKTEKGGPSAEQVRFIDEINAARGHGFISYGLDEALCWLKAQGLLR